MGKQARKSGVGDFVGSGVGRSRLAADASVGLPNYGLEQSIDEYAMRNNALYFPYINVPSNAWFFRVLLYWDKVSSIVPYEYVYNPEALAPHMRDLLTAELVEQVMPGSYIHRIPNFEEAFLNYVHHQLRRRWLHRARLSHPFSIHIEKMGRIADELVKLGLARPAQYPWYEVEDWVASAFMEYLASVLGKVDEIDAAPVTNDRNSCRLFTENHVLSSSQETIERARIRELLLSNLLPAPTELPSIDSLLNFKLSYGEKLSALRNTIERRCIEIANIRSDEAREDMVTALLSEIEDAIEEISEAMKSRWKRITFGTLIPILGAGASMLAEDLHNPMSITAASFSLVNAIYQAFEGVRNYEQILNQPLAYVALARATFK